MIGTCRAATSSSGRGSRCGGRELRGAARRSDLRGARSARRDVGGVSPHRTVALQASGPIALPADDLSERSRRLGIPINRRCSSLDCDRRSRSRARAASRWNGPALADRWRARRPARSTLPLLARPWGMCPRATDARVGRAQARRVEAAHRRARAPGEPPRSSLTTERSGRGRRRMPPAREDRSGRPAARRKADPRQLCACLDGRR